MLFECDRAKILIQDFHSHNTGSVENFDYTESFHDVCDITT